MKPTIITTADVIDRLRVGRARLIRTGWCQGTVGALVDGSCCAWGALYWEARPISANVRDIDISRRAAEVIVATLNQQPIAEIMGWWYSLTSWNDQRGRTVEEVLAVFDAAIARLEAELAL